MQFREFIRLVTPPIIPVLLRKGLARSPRSDDRNEQPAVAEKPCLELAHVQALAARVPELARFSFHPTAQNAAPLLDFYNAYLPFVMPEARGAALRTLLAKLANEAPDLADQAKDAIAVSDLSDGLPDRAKRLFSHPEHVEELRSQIADAQGCYGADYITGDWGNPSRGRSILYYLQSHPDIVAGKDVMHIAPENETRTWLKENSRYTVFDGTPDSQTDLAGDIVNIPASSETFDVVLCHRVLEHVLDDVGAMREIFRILKPGGLLNMSVPQAPHRHATVEWLVQDGSHHDHVRQYGTDLIDRLRSVGFDVALENWLVAQPGEALVSQSAFPLRMYNARKPA